MKRLAKRLGRNSTDCEIIIVKLIIFTFMILLLAIPAMAATLSWDASIGAEGYQVNWRAVGAPAWTQVPMTVMETSFDLDTLPLVADTRYEFQVFATADGSVSGGSDIIRWTFEGDPAMIEIFESPKSLTFNP